MAIFGSFGHCLPNIFTAQCTLVQMRGLAIACGMWYCGTLENKSGNISETGKDRRKVTMDGL